MGGLLSGVLGGIGTVVGGIAKGVGGLLGGIFKGIGTIAQGFGGLLLGDALNAPQSLLPAPAQQPTARSKSPFLNIGATEVPTSNLSMADSPQLGAIPPEIPERSTSQSLRDSFLKNPVSPEWMAKVAQIESNNNPKAVSKTGAQGLYQFLPSTWKGLGIQGSPFDPEVAKKAMIQFSTQNYKQLSNKMGRNISPSELYMAHNLGVGGATRLLSAPDDAVLSKALIGSNPSHNPKFLMNGKYPVTAAEARLRYQKEFEPDVLTPEQRVQTTTALKDPSPYTLAASYLGKTEQGNTDTLTQFFKRSLGDKNAIDPRVVPWCAHFVNAVLKSSGMQGTDNFAARSFLKYGTETKSPIQGDVVVMSFTDDQSKGHVGFFDSYKTVNGKPYIVVVGGNQSNSVSKKAYPIGNVLGIRRPPSKQELKAFSGQEGI